MAKRTYIGVNNLTKLGKRFYIGVGNAAKKVKKMYIGVGGFALSNAVKQSTQTGQTGSIVGTKTLPFDSATGVKPLGSTASYTMSSLLTSGDIVYTLVSGNQITYKKVTDSKTSTTGGGYTEGTETSSSSSGNTSSIYGSTTYSFSTTTGKYTLGSNSSHDLSSLYSSSQRIYTSGGSTLTSKQVTNRTYHEGSEGEYVQEYYESSPSYYASGSVTIFIDPNSYFYSSCVKGSSAGGGLYYSLSGGEWPYSYRFNSDDEESQGPVYIVTAGTASQATGVVKYWAEWDGSSLTVYSQTLGINGYMSGGSDPYYSYTVRTYSKGSTYTQGSSSTTYTVETYTQNTSGSTSGLARLCYILGFKFGAARQVSTASGQTAAITGTFTVPTINDNGQIVLGSTSSQSLSTIYNRSDHIIYTSVDSAKDTLTYKTVTNPTTVYSEGSESTTTATGQSASTSITYYPSYSFSTSTGKYTLTGTKTTKTLSSLGVNTSTKLYTTGGTSLVYKKITNSSSTTIYTEGSASSSTSYAYSDSSISGYTSYSFNSSNGQYSSAGSSTNPWYSTMYSNGTTVYTGFGSNLTYKKVTNKSTSTDYYYEEGSWEYIGSDTAYYDTTYSGYMNYSFSSGSGYEPTFWTSFNAWEGDSVYQTFYEGGGSTLTKYVYNGNGYGDINVSIYRATASMNSSTSTTYTITTYTKGSKKSSGTTYTVTTTTKGRTSGTAYTVTTYEKDVVEGE